MAWRLRVSSIEGLGILRSYNLQDGFEASVSSAVGDDFHVNEGIRQGFALVGLWK